jgi:hypothetical protein
MANIYLYLKKEIRKRTRPWMVPGVILFIVSVIDYGMIDGELLEFSFLWRRYRE